MTEKRVPYDAGRSALKDLLSIEQQDRLADELAEVMRSGFGEITITVQKGHVRFIRSLVSIEFPANSSNNL